MNRNINVQFCILESIAIILVVMGHATGGGFSVFDSFFPVGSYQMPLFIFISGYFYSRINENRVRDFIWNKFKKLIIPTYILNICYGFITTGLRNIGVIEFGGGMTFNNLFLEPFKTGHQFGLNVSMWYVPALFLIQITYIIVRKAFSRWKYFDDLKLMILLLLSGVFVVKLAYLDYRRDWWLVLQHVLYGLPFYHLGQLYKLRLEPKDNIQSIFYFSFLFLVQFILTQVLKINASIGMFNADYNHLTTYSFMAFVIPLPGILFWLRVSKVLVPSFVGDSIVRFIGKNTWSVMAHHQFVFFAFNFLLLKIKDWHVGASMFDRDAFRTNIWYTYEAFNSFHFRFIYVILGVSIPLLIKYLLQKSKIENFILKYILKIF